MAKYRLPIDKSQAASAMGVSLGADTSARQNGSVGGYMVKKTFESFGQR
ncbi:MAG: small, acid-soluble spore protein, alpha/beta type [Peptococcaceae bacterium]|nr:small, acid-soluble spore protein, alpha/beta type [Peptococcaceae bacterium]